MLKLLTGALILSILAKADSSDDSDNDSSDDRPRHHRRIFYIRQRDFDDGTLRITEPGTYRLREDIEFNPLRNPQYPNADGSYRVFNDDAYPGSDDTPGAFRLGFFAAITIEVDGVILDLNRYTLSQHREHLMQQRFYTHVQANNAPFIQGQGPADFGPQTECIGITIKNGNLGLSSHFGIHGNGATDITIKDVNFFDFEVAAIQLNKFNRATIEHCDIGPSLTSVPVMGYYSNARFLLPNLFKTAMDDGSSEISFADRTESVTLQQVFDDLHTSMDLFFEKTIFGSVSNANLRADKRNPALLRKGLDLFQNKDGLPDGSALYGIELNSRGIGVEWFGDSLEESYEANIKNVKIHDLNLRVNEFLGYIQEEDNALAKGPFGDLVDFNLILDDVYDLSSSYRGNLLADGQIALAIFGEEGESQLAGTNIDAETISFATEGTALPGKLSCNEDVMDHTNKGVVGIRIDNSDYISLEDVTVEYLHNWSELGSDACVVDGYYTAQKSLPDGMGYQGAVSRGISIVDSAVSLTDVTIRNVGSASGTAVGIDVFGVSAVALEGDIHVSNILAGECLKIPDFEDIASDDNPNETPVSCGIRTNDDSSLDQSDADVTTSCVDQDFC